MCFAVSTFGVGGPNQNTSRIQHKNSLIRNPYLIYDPPPSQPVNHRLTNFSEEGTIIYLLGYKIIFTRGFLVPNFSKKINKKTKIIGYTRK